MPNLIKAAFKGGADAIEDYLSVNEQVKGMKKTENKSGAEKLYELMMEQMDFDQSINFSKEALAKGSTNKFDRDRESTFPDPDTTRQDMAGHGRTRGELEMSGEREGQNYFEQRQKMIERHVESVRADLDVSYDQLYAKEKQLVQDIIRTQKAYDDAIKQQANPAGIYEFS